MGGNVIKLKRVSNSKKKKKKRILTISTFLTIYSTFVNKLEFAGRWRDKDAEKRQLFPGWIPCMCSHLLLTCCLKGLEDRVSSNSYDLKWLLCISMLHRNKEINREKNQKGCIYIKENFSQQRPFSGESYTVYLFCKHTDKL